jgi:hypothetical protein
VLVTAGEVIEQLFGAFISWHTCTLKSRRRIASPEIRTKRMSIFKLQHGMAGHKMVLRRSNMRKRMSALVGWDRGADRAPLWVKSGHGDNAVGCPLYPRKRTFIAGV